MRIKELKIHWQSVEPSTDVTFACQLTFDIGSEAPEKAYTKAIAAMRACLIEEGAQYDPAILEEVQ